MNNKVNSIS